MDIDLRQPLPYGHGSKLMPEQILNAVQVERLAYSYNGTAALRGIGFTVGSGEIFGLLGPNGGGKTTVFRILSTLLLPDSGNASVFGVDVVRDPLAARRRIGVVFQNQSLDRRLTAKENLVHQGHLYGLQGKPLEQRIDEVLTRLGLADRAASIVEKLSGGLRRRVELAKGLLHQPDLLLLDEPSTGIDPGARLDFWEYLQLLRRQEGVTVLLTTHLLDEADKCDRLAILDRGAIVADGTPAELKNRIGGDVVALTCNDADNLAARLPQAIGVTPQVIDGTVRFEHADGPRLVARLMEELPLQIDSVTVSKPSLEDVFIQLTGHRFLEETADEDQR